MGRKATPRQPATLSERDAIRLVKARIEEIGGPTMAARHWGISPQMLHMVLRTERRLTDTMLKDLRLEVVDPPRRYRRAA